MTRRPIIAVTMGDPAGIGPEVCLRLIERITPGAPFRLAILGNARVLAWAADTLRLPLDVLGHTAGDRQQWTDGDDDWAVWHIPTAGLELPVASIDTKLVPRSGPSSSVAHSAVDAMPDAAAAVTEGDLPLPAPNRQVLESESLRPGRVTAATGYAAYAYIDQAIEAVLAGRVAAVTTAPLHKEALHWAGIDFPGHTEIFAQRCGSRRWCMMQYSEPITCTFVTVHTGYTEVPDLLNPQRILDVILLTVEALERLRTGAPRLVVCGLNPHAGEGGLFGHGEEQRLIVPAIEAARAQGIDIQGPLPADTAFVPARRAETDAFVCMYHDQGHIPVKALAFDSAVNTTLGLPVVRTSVDHGTALDIAWQGRANPGSLLAAVELAWRLASGQRPDTQARSTRSERG